MAIYGAGGELDLTFKITDELKTTTSQFMCVGQAPGTTTAADRTVSLCGVANSIGSATGTAFHFIGIVQSYQSASSEVATVRTFGVSKAVCAESIPAMAPVMAYWGVSTTTMAGRIVCVDDGVSTSAATMSTSAHVIIIGRALESGSTGTVISILIQPSLYDLNLVGSISIT